MTRESAANGEWISALVDGELPVGELPSVVDSVAGTAEGLVRWQAYHLVGDALRGSAHVAALDGQDFVARLRARLAEQEIVRPPAGAVAPAGATVVFRARAGANDPVMRWKLVAGLTSFAAMATFGWHFASLDAGAGIVAQSAAVPGVQAIATVPAAAAPTPILSAAPVMLRDARLDELLAAHKQFGGTSALQKPAGFLRNATFDGSAR